MISYLVGTIHDKHKGSLTLLTSAGVGYDVYVAPHVFADLNVGQDAELYTYLKVSEQAHDLYGFATKDEKAFFELLLSVKGVGPKGALNILSLGSIANIQDAIARADIGYLTQVSGLGKKTAERMCVELKSKVGKVSKAGVPGSDSGVLGDVVEGLAAMGYTKEEAREAVQHLDATNKKAEALLREALSLLLR